MVTAFLRILRRWVSAEEGRSSFTLEIAAAVAVLIVLSATYFFVLRDLSAHQALLSGLSGLLLMLGNLLPVVLLIILIGRRIAVRRALKDDVQNTGGLHATLVTLFSVLASVPIILTVIAAAILFQARNQYWVSNRAQNAFETTINLVRDTQDQFIERWSSEATVMAEDLARNIDLYPVQTQIGLDYLKMQTAYRNLKESVLFRYDPQKGIEVLEVINPPPPEVLARRVNKQLLDLLSRSNGPAIDRNDKTIWVVTRLPDTKGLYLYVGTGENAEFLSRQRVAATNVIEEYKTLQARAQTYQLQFIGALFLAAILIVAVTVWIALAVADRLVQPVNALVRASRDVEQGDLGARVAESASFDEIGTLGRAFNQMAGRLQKQTNALVRANTELESRRALIEAVMSGVSAGIISIDADHEIRLMNSAAAELLAVTEAKAIGQPLAEIAPELDAMVQNGTREAIIQIVTSGEAKTLAVKLTRDERGQVLTFDDITQQLLDQRRAAWSDVARRIAHEIKNPLTPIQLAAERLQRRYGKQVEADDDGVFARLTETIVRQVGDLRRMVDEFSSFARMPKPVFREESLLDIGRQALFLQEVALPDINFNLSHDDNPLVLVCDRRQLGQALSNIVKNACEAIEAREGEDLPKGEVSMRIAQEQEGMLTVEVRDNGIGLPVERDRIFEPYMTTRSRGTGLGLAIVKKIIEEHFGTIQYSDAPGGGTCVTIHFDTNLLAGLAGGETDTGDTKEPSVPSLTRIGTN